MDLANCANPALYAAKAKRPHTPKRGGSIFNRRCRWPTFQPLEVAHFSTGLDTKSQPRERNCLDPDDTGYGEHGYAQQSKGEANCQLVEADAERQQHSGPALDGRLWHYNHHR